MTSAPLDLLQPLTHYSLHLLLPAAIAYRYDRQRWVRAYLILLATMLVDLDHLFAYPAIFVPDRCSINLHPLHSWWAIVIYLILVLPPRTRLVAIGLLLHMFADAQDCLWMAYLPFNR